MKNFEFNLPLNYELKKKIDANDKKTGLLLTVITLVITVILVIAGTFIYQSITKKSFNIGSLGILRLLIFFVGYIVLIILHELIHGLFYKIFTKQKLSFGLTIFVAYCGVPNLYVYKKPMIITALATCVIISTTLLIPMILVNNINNFWILLLMFSCHFGGCCGDIYSVLLLKLKFKGNTVLINDTGPVQTIYDVKE